MKISLKNFFRVALLIVSATLLIRPAAFAADWVKADPDAKKASEKIDPEKVVEKVEKTDTEAPASISPPTKAQTATLEKFQKRLNGAGQVRATVNRRTKIGLLGTEKVASGDLLLSQGKVRMDLKIKDTEERQLLVVGDKAFWAVSYPPKELKDALIQVVTGPVKSKKSGPTGFLALLGNSGFLKSFTVTGVSLEKDGGIRYYLQPKADWVEAKRAVLALGPESSGKKSEAGQRDFREILIWDFQNNETQFTLDDVSLEKTKAAKDKFSFSPPKNSDVMSVAK